MSAAHATVVRFVVRGFCPECSKRVEALTSLS